MNCKHCNKPFSCGCQKTSVNGIIIHKTCKAEWEEKQKKLQKLSSN